MATGDDSAPGYWWGLKVLHWAMFVAIAVQFALGLGLDDAGGVLEVAMDRWWGGEEDVLVLVHAAVGVAILAMATVRVMVRWVTDLPPWAPGLSSTERRIVHFTERALYACMFLVPLTGLGLLLLSGEDWDLPAGQFVAPLEVVDDDVWLGAHVTMQVLFVAAFAIHMWIVVRHSLRREEHYLSRMR